MKEIVGPDRTVVGWVKNDKRRVLYRIELEQDDLARLALRAAGNKSGKAQDGPLTITVMEMNGVNP